MKKVVSLLLVTALLIGALSACKRNEPEPEPAPPEPVTPTYDYQDGEYAVSYAVPALDRTLDYLTISIKNDEITIVEAGCKEDVSLPAPSEETSGDAASAPAEPAAPSEPASSDASSEAAPAGESEYEAKANAQMKDIVAEYEAVEGDLERMEPVEGAEEHTYRFMRMMRTALKFAKAGDHTPVELGKYEDGSYEAVMPSFSASGWKDYVRLTVKDGLITDIDFNAQKESDPSVLITDDPDLNKEGATDSPSVYYPAIAKAFTDSNENLDSLSVPTGGAAAAKSFQKLMKPLLASMISGGGTQVTAPRYVDGTYKAQMKEFDEHGWKDYVVVQIRSDKVSVKEFDAVSKEDENKLKSQDAEMAAQMEEMTGTGPEAYTKELRSNLDAAGGDPVERDTVAGATVSSNNFRLLVGQILATAAVNGDTEKTLEVESFPADLGPAEEEASSSSEAAA